MKLLNRKGFTLIELLAVIIILGVVMVLTIPSVIDSMNNAKHKQLQNAANKVADYLLEQYTLYQMDPSSASKLFKDNLSTHVNSSTDGTSSYYIPSNILEEAGISNASDQILTNSTVTYSIFFYNTSKNKMCVKLQARSGGEFYNSNTSDPTEKNKNAAFSSGCPIKEPNTSYTWSTVK